MAELEVRSSDWLSDEEIDPRTLQVLDCLHGVVDAMAEAEVPMHVLANVTLNVYMKCFAACKPSDAMIDGTWPILRKGIQQLRDEDPVTQQG